MKKLLTILLAVLCALTLAACGKKDDGGNTKSTLVLYQNKGEVTTPMQAWADKWGAENGVEVTIKTCTGSCDYGSSMKADIAANEAPDIFIIEGDTGYEIYKDMMAPFDANDEWIANTEYEFVKDGNVYGFPVAIEGYGLGYNKDILDKAGVDPATLTTIDGYRAAFEKIDSMKDELGLTGVVSLVTSDGQYWVMAQHDFAGYLSVGVDYYDTSVIDLALQGKVDMDRLNTYADWVELLYQYTDSKMLTIGTSDQQFAEFGLGHYAFIHQGSWGDTNISSAGGNFEQGFAPYATLGNTESTGLFAGAPSWYVLNKNGNTELARKFLNDYAMTDEGQKLMVNEIGLVSAFSNNPYRPTGKLSIALSNWIADGNTTYSFTNQYKTPDGFNMNVLGPLYNQFALGNITKAEFVSMFANAIAELPTYGK